MSQSKEAFVIFLVFPHSKEGETEFQSRGRACDWPLIVIIVSFSDMRAHERAKVPK